jgi:arylsulfatase A-like enzyme
MTSSFISRRKWVRGVGRALVAIALSFHATSMAGADNARPNILFIMADDLGYADAGCYGAPEIKTPHIDELAARGVRFLQGYANSAVCSATRVALMTGRYQYRVRVGLEEPLVSPEGGGLDPAHPTLPSLLKKAGYRTTLVGKWHLGLLPKHGPLQSGYDEFFGFRGGAVDYFTHGEGRRKDLWEDDTPVERAGYLTELLGDRAVQVVNESAKSAQPFLLSLHFSAPHWPWEAPGDAAEAERLSKPGSHGGLFHYDGGSLQTYRRMVESMDQQIGRVLQALEENGLTENTIVVFTSDNGGERFSNTWPFSGRKAELLEGGLRVPTIVSWPARLPKGAVTSQVAITMDWLPTLLAAAETTHDPDYLPDGIDLLPALATDSVTLARKLFWRFKANGQRAMRDGDLKLLKLRENTFLFNVVDDPLERANLKDRLKADYSRMAREWHAWNEAMLPELKEATSGTPDARTAADRYGVKRADGTPDTSSMVEAE